MGIQGVVGRLRKEDEGNGGEMRGRLRRGENKTIEAKERKRRNEEGLSEAVSEQPSPQKARKKQEKDGSGEDEGSEDMAGSGAE
ncbi:hypothetical protein LTR08_000912 [Meristemomyces frigidus]|nr:hypothetical protein LTR08_000912 [Meristemomyces frigidus]